MQIVPPSTKAAVPIEPVKSKFFLGHQVLKKKTKKNKKITGNLSFLNVTL